MLFQLHVPNHGYLQLHYNETKILDKPETETKKLSNHALFKLKYSRCPNQYPLSIFLAMQVDYKTVEHLQKNESKSTNREKINT